MPGFMNPYGGRGLGMAWGRGGGWGMGMAWRRGWGGGWGGYMPAPYAPAAHRPYPLWGTPSREDELKMLQSQADWLKQQMSAVDERIKELGEEQD
jgi:hypothetical protein